MRKFFLLSMMALFLVSCSAGPEHYNVVFITLDTTRADYVDTGGIEGAKAFTPELKRFANNSVVFERAYCAIPQTLPSHLSMFTSYNPQDFGVFSNEHLFDGKFKTLPQVFKEKGYYTAGIISLGTLASATGFPRGFDVFLENLNEPGVFYTPAKKVTEEALDILAKVKNDKFFLFLHYSDPHAPYAPPSVNGDFNVFLDGKPIVSFNAYRGAILKKEILLSPGVHTIDFKCESRSNDFNFFVLRKLFFSDNCSVKYNNLEYSKEHYNGSHLMRGKSGGVKVTCKTEGRMKLFQVIPILTWKASVDYYRKEVEYMDLYVGKFLAALKKKKLSEKTIVVVTSDHGEGLGEREHYFGHVRYLNQQFIRVPLMIYFPGMETKRISTPVSLTWIAPALLDFAGIEDSVFKNRESVMKWIKNDNEKPSPVYSYVFKPSSSDDRFSIVKWPYQCIYSKGGDNTDTHGMELYNLALSQSFRKMDECSSEVLMKYAPAEYHFLQQSYRQVRNLFLSRNDTKTKINKKEIENLKTLGYLQ